MRDLNKQVEEFTHFEIEFLKQFEIYPSMETLDNFKSKMINYIQMSQVSNEAKDEVELLINKLINLSENDYILLKEVL